MVLNWDLGWSRDDVDGLDSGKLLQNSGDQGRMKRAYDGIGVELGGDSSSAGEESDREGGGKKVRVLERGDDKIVTYEVVGNRAMGFGESGPLDERGGKPCLDGSGEKEVGSEGDAQVGGLGNVGIGIFSEEVDQQQNWGLGLRLEEETRNDNPGEFEWQVFNLNDGNGDRISDSIFDWDLNLNEPFWGAGYGKNGMGFQEFTQIGQEIAETRAEIIDISSDDEDDHTITGIRDDRGKGKVIQTGFLQEYMQGLDLDLGTAERQWTVEVSSSRRYTREEKGKTKVVDSWLSLATDPRKLDLTPDAQELIDSGVSQNSEGIKINEGVQNWAAQRAEMEEARRAENAIKFRETAKSHALRFARAISQPEENPQEPLKENQELEIPPAEANMKLEDFPGPFSAALKTLTERNTKWNAQQLIEWKPLEHCSSNIRTPMVPSLLDLSLKTLAKYPEAIASLNHIPDWLRQRFTNLLCDRRKMNVHVLDLLLRDSPTEIRVKDCSWITEEQARKTFAEIDAKSLRVLQLDLCGQCVIDGILRKFFIQTSNRLLGLRIISLRGACRLSDELLKALVTSAPQLQSINVGQSSLLTCTGIKFLADILGPSLRELYVDDCQKIDAMLTIPSFRKFQHLEVLSVAGIDSVCDEFIGNTVTTTMKELDLANCGKLTDVTLKVIGKYCPELHSLNISNLSKVTDLGLLYLANGCRSVQALKFYRNGFSDEAIAAFVEASGESLKELSLNGVSKVGPSTALSLAKCSRNLSSLDISWCRRISDEALGLIVDSCSSLRLLKLFGCTQITNMLLNGHSNSLVQIVGLSLSPLLEHVSMLEPEEVLLRYSPF